MTSIQGSSAKRIRAKFPGCVALILVVCCSWLFDVRLACGMDLGANFWNPGWHKASDCFQDVARVTGDNPWNPQFLDEIGIYRSLRFMDWDNTNGSERERWSQRTQKTALKQNPVAYEWMIDLCNRSRADLWVTVPHRTIPHTLTNAPSDYALRLCLLVKTGIDMGGADLRPVESRLLKMTAEDLIRLGGIKTAEPLDLRLKFYVEYSNETWNGVFKQAHDCCDEGLALGMDTNRWTAGFRYHAWAAIRLFRAADLVFGADSPRVVKVLAAFTSNPWIAQQHLDVLSDSRWNPWGVKANALATAPYFGHQVQGDSPEAIEQLRSAIQKSAEQSSRHKQIADRAGLKLIAYEGGQHVVKKAAIVNRNPVMFTLYQEYLRAMSQYFTHFSHYNHVGQAGDGGAWGALEYTGQPLEQAHKYRALADWAKNQPAATNTVPVDSEVPYPRIAMLWASVRKDRSLEGMARHDLIMTSAGRFGLKPNRAPQGLADGFAPESVPLTRERLAELRRLNPRVIILCDQSFYEYADSWLPEDHPWWLRKNGQRQQFWPGTHRTDWSNPEYQRKVVRQTVACQEVGFDGVFYDNLRLEKEPWIEVMKAVRSAVGDRFLILANCGYDVGNYDWLAPWLNGIMYESGWSHGRVEWEECIRKMRQTQTLLRPPRISVIERFEEIRDQAGWPNDPRKGQERPRDPAARRWSLCYALLIGDCYYLFSDSTSHQHDWHAEYDVKIGQPKGPAQRINAHVWQRRYDRALVIVNLPGAKAPYEVVRDQAAKDTLSGQTGTRFDIPPGDGRILLDPANEASSGFR
ncbi:MAG TPA: putative glycoside hydrolase [Candidatus Paceibacterota bacterium]|nr:putative glycoside hydrolase [Verrucomicrobiota bacterium]HRY50539.1 putative glycoside hydrolase [Candidatus Paceibacterota bacterium]HSA00286.1 putative glycoside hydrolase [Candidatus Paceibacterota bacterium]